MEKGKTIKVVYALLGLAMLFAGIGAYNSAFLNYTNPIIMALAAFIIFTQIMWSKLVDKKFAFDDVMNGVGVVLLVAMVLAVIVTLPFVPFSLPAFVSSIATIGIGVTGIYIIVKGLMM